jgi:NAD(P)-dependent dehydrogenase (short-subunit alcohol dehydrogenase family)
VAATMRKPEGFAGFQDPDKRISIFKLDVTDAASIERAVKEVLVAFGHLDVLVNNAGYGLVGPFEAMEDQQIRRQFETNVFGLMAMTRAVLPQMRARRQGHIVNVASVGGRLTFPFYSIYHATKWAVEGFSESLVSELREFGVHVKIIEPGPIRTEFYERSEDQPPAERLGAYATTFQRVYARMRRFGARAPGPEVVAAAILEAATDTSYQLRYMPNGRLILAARRIFGPSLYLRRSRRLLKLKA